MSFRPLFFALLSTALVARAELRVPAFTAYLTPNADGARVSEKSGVRGWKDPAVKVVWFGEVKTPGKIEAALELVLPSDAKTRLQLTVGDNSREAEVVGTGEKQRVDFGSYEIAKTGYTRFELSSPQPAGDLEALILDGPALKDAHFNLEPRRNAASVHLRYAMPKEQQVAAFYNEVVAVEDPVATFYMACGFSRGYFGMQVNSPTERRIIFSIWDSGAGSNADRRDQVAAEDHVQLLEKGEGVVTNAFGGEGTGGHSHLVFPWKTGEPQRFVVTVRPDGSFTEYTGHWFHPEKKAWQLIARFRAPKDGKWLSGLHSFSENFGGSTGHLPRKARFGPTWIRTTNGDWQELTRASFSQIHG